MTRARLLLIAVLCTVLTSLCAVAAYFIGSELNQKIDRRLLNGRPLAPLEVFSRGAIVSVGRKFPRDELTREFEDRKLNPSRDYIFDVGPACGERAGLNTEVPADRSCVWVKDPALVVTWDAGGWVTAVWREGQSIESTSLYPKLITQIFDGQPILRQNLTLGEVPLACLQAVTAIEDREFLDHRGVSLTGTLRALLRNVRHGRWAEGGSTITQQLVKNFFLNAKKTLRRKMEEQALALLLEARVPKDQILEMYLNVIYMGQSGPYQVRGFASAARAYFDRALPDLSLPECAMLAALINSPGRYGPRDHPVAARGRRELVLRKMREAGMINEEEATTAAAAPLPGPAPAALRPHAPYFVMSALREFHEWSLDADEGARLYTTLDADAQVALNRAVDETLPLVAKRVRKSSAQPLQAAGLTVDVARAEIIALVGGRDFHAAPYNRATDARRQIGSLIKPFVFLSAGDALDPLTEVIDEPFEWTEGRQIWRPRNFEKKSLGPVPYFFVLAHSLNVPAAKVGREVGLAAIQDALVHAGVRTPAPRLPSLTLGAFETTLVEVAQAYTTLARQGAGDWVHSLARAEDGAGESLFERRAADNLRLDPRATAIVNGMLRQVVNIGTARTIRTAGLTGDFAGKTGTTNDTKDAWFIGFDGRLLTAVWVGFDDNTPTGLTGATAALPIWVAQTRALGNIYQGKNLPVVDGTEERDISREELVRHFPNVNGLTETLRLVFSRR